MWGNTSERFVFVASTAALLGKTYSIHTKTYIKVCAYDVSSLAFNDVLKTPPVTAACVYNQLSSLLNKAIIKRVMICGDNDAIYPS